MITNPLLNGIFFSCDMLEFKIKDIYNDLKFKDFGINLVFNLDDDNTPNAYINLFDHIFTYRKTKNKSNDDLYIFTTSIDNISIDCFYIIFGGLNNFGSKNNDRAGFYSSFFVLEKMNKLNFTLLDFFEFLFPLDSELYRIDICLDLPNQINELLQTVFSGTRFYSQIGEDKKHPEFSQTYYIKNPKTSQNRSYIFRIYDKVLDTFRKGKFFLYPHLKNNPDVRRIELEMRPKECELYKSYPISDFLTNKNKILQNIFADYLNKNINQKYFLDYTKVTCDKHYNNITDLQKLFLEIGHIPNDYLSRAHGYIRNIKENTGYAGLFDTLLKVEKESIQTIHNSTTSYQAEIMKRYGYNIKMKISIINRNIINSFELLEQLILYIKKNNLDPNILNQILKRHIKNQTIKFKK